MSENETDQLTDEQAVVFTQEETLIMMSVMAVTISAYEKILLSISKMTQNHMWREKKGTAVIKHLTKLIDEPMSALFAEQHLIREKTRGMVTNKKALDDMIVNISHIVNSVRQDPGQHIIDKALIGDTVNKYEHEVVGDVVPAAEDGEIKLPNRSELSALFAQQKREQGERLIAESIKKGIEEEKKKVVGEK